MAHESEAACLLRTGTVYSERVGLRRADDDLVFFGVKRGAFSVYWNDDPVLHADLDGRWQRLFLGGTHYVKDLNTSVRSIDRVREGPYLVMLQRTLNFAETADIDARVRSLAIELLEQRASPAASLAPPPTGVKPLDDSVRVELLERVARWDANAWFSQRELFHHTYSATRVLLPPTAGNFVRVEATFIDQPGEHLIQRDPAEFADHLANIARLWGSRIAQSNGVFLAGPDALRQSLESLKSQLAQVRAALRASGDNGNVREPVVESLLEQFEPVGLGVDDWRALRELGLRGICLGLYSGDDSMRAALGLSPVGGAIQETAARAKHAKIAISVIVLSGVEPAEPHARETLACLRSLNLGAGDAVYVVDAADSDRSRALAHSPTSTRDSLRAEISSVLRERGVKTLTFDPAKR